MKEHERGELEKIEKLRNELESHPLTCQMRAEKKAAILVMREAAAEKIKSLTRELESHAEKQVEIDELAARLAILDNERRELQEQIGAKWYQLARGRAGIEGEIRHEEQILHGCYDPKIDEAIQFFRDKLDYLRSPGRISRNTLGGERNIFTETVRLTTESNIDAIHEALSYCQGAILKLNGMKLRPDFSLQEIEALKSGIPKIDIYSEYEAVKPLPGSKSYDPLSPLARLATENESNWKVKTLLEKVGKYISAPKKARA